MGAHRRENRGMVSGIRNGTRGTARGAGRRRAAAGARLACLALPCAVAMAAMPPMAARAQVHVTNAVAGNAFVAGPTQGSGSSESTLHLAQPFTTPSGSGGIPLRNVVLHFSSMPLSLDQVKLYLYRAKGNPNPTNPAAFAPTVPDSGTVDSTTNEPAAAGRLAEFAVPVSLGGGRYRFGAPAGTALDADTTYHLYLWSVANLTGPRWRSVDITSTPGGAPGDAGFTGNTTQCAPGGWALLRGLSDDPKNTSDDGWIPDGNGRHAYVTEIVGEPNRLPSQGPAIAGIQTIGETLTADTATIADANGAPSSFAYAWYRTDADGTNSQAIPGATSRTYTPTEDDEGRRLRVQVAYADAHCYRQTTSVGADNTFAAGLALDGTAQVGQTLTAATDGIEDADGLPSAPAFTYRWTRVDADGASNPEDIAGATSRTYTPVAADEGKRVRVTVGFVDRDGHREVVGALSGTVAEGTPAVAPEFLRASVNGRVLTVTMNETLDGDEAPAASAFTVSGGHAVSGVTVSGSAVTLTLASVVGAGETVTVSYAAPGSGSVLQGEGGTAAAAFSDRPVANETPTVTLVLTPSSIGENGGTSTVTASLDRPSPRPTTVTVTAVPVSPATADDYALNGSELTIAADSLASTGSVTITATDNDEDAPDRTVTVSGTAANAQGVTGPDDATLTITDDDDPPPAVLSIDDASATEGDAGDTPLAFTVRLTPEAKEAVTVDWRTSDGTATAGTDYTAGTGSLTFGPGETVRTVTVQATGDGVDEPDETFTVTLSNVSASSGSSVAVLGDGTATGTIVDDDLPVVTVVSGGDVAEGGDARFTLTRSGTDIAGPLAVTFSVTGGDAVLSGAAPTAATFGANAATVTVAVPTTDDLTDEPDATLTLALADGDAYDLGAPARAEAVVRDNEATPALGVADASASESDDLVFALTLDPASWQAVSVDWAITPVTAEAADYTGATSGTVTFQPGETSANITLDLADDDLREEEETVEVALSGLRPSSAATLADGTATGTIEDNDPPSARPGALALNVPSQAVRYVAGDAVELVLPAANGGTGPYVYTLAPLPAGLSFDGGTRTLSGTPTVPGVARVTYGARDAADPPATVTRTFNLRIKKSRQPGPTLTLNVPSQAVRHVAGDAVELVLPAANGGTGPYVYTLAPLPAGLSFDGGTRTLSGTPTVPGVTRVTYGARDAADPPATATRTFNLRVKRKRSSSMTLASPARLVYEVGDTVDLTLPPAAGGAGPHSYALAPLSAGSVFGYTGTSLPAGLSFDGSTRRLSGTPTAPGIVRLRYGARDAAGLSAFARQVFKIRIRAARASSMTLSASVGLAYEVGDTVDLTLPAAVGGAGPYTYTLGPLPAGLSFDRSTRRLSGTPTAPGATRMTYAATDAADPPVTVTRTVRMSVGGSVVTIAAEADAVAEGEDAVFVLARTGDASAPLTVAVEVGEAGSVLAGAAPTEAAFGENETETRLRVATEDDSTAEADGRVTATVSAGAGYAVSADAGSAGVDVLDDDGAGFPKGAEPWPATLAVADARVNESAGTPLVFRVELSGKRSSAVSVRYATSDGSATAGADYVAASGVVRFEAGETVRTVRVAVLEDSHDEGEETMTLALSRPFGAAVPDGTATGTIVNTDPMPRAWLGRFGRAVAGQVLDAVEARMTAERRPGVEASVAGRRLGAAAARGGVASRGGAGLDLSGLLATSGGELLSGTSFALTDGTAGGGFGSVWGRGAVTGFDGRDGGLPVDGEVRTGLLGADWMRAGWAAGLIVGHSRGEGDYGGQGAGTVSSSLTGFYPWGRRELGDRVTAWGVAGYGEGTLTLEPEGGARIETGMDLAMAAAGLRGVLVEAPAGGGLELAARTDGLVARTSSEAGRGGAGGMLEAADADVTRLRLGLEGARAFRPEGGGTLTPSFELAARHDGGDAETGFGVDVGAGVAYADPSSGVTADLRGRGLVAHAASGFREVGFSGSLAFDPTPSSGRGPSLRLVRSVGASATGGAEALHGRGTMAGLAAGDGAVAADSPGRRSLEIRAGYGLSALGGRFTGTPEFGFGVSGSGRDYSLGWRLAPEGRNAGRFAFRLEATRSETTNGDAPGHGAVLRATMRW